ncbi:hypothetical protein PISMIDRAFT_690982, partial [Pisolithus microcarpus 441]
HRSREIFASGHKVLLFSQFTTTLDITELRHHHGSKFRTLKWISKRRIGRTDRTKPMQAT